MKRWILKSVDVEGLSLSGVKRLNLTVTRRLWNAKLTWS